jgi:outer membrane biosynthesis protein TonB
MRRVFGPRTVVEAAFLVAVPVVAAALGASMYPIIAAAAVAYLLIFVLEATLGRQGAPTAGRSRLRIPSRSVTVEPAAAEPEPASALESVVVRPGHDGSSGEAAAEPPLPEVPLPEVPLPEPSAAPEPPTAPEPSRSAPAPSEHEHVRVLRPEPAPEPVAARPQLTSVPELEPEPEPTPVTPAPAPEPSTVVPIGVGAGPRQWNLWDLERLTREHAGGDVARDEERQFLLMYMREFADSSGLLPLDFDGLVRDSFGELVGSR